MWCCRRLSQSPTYHPLCCSAQTCPRQHAPVTHTQQNYYCYCCCCCCCCSCCYRSDLLPATNTVNGAKARLAFIILRCTWQKASKYIQQYNKTLTPRKLIYNKLPDGVVLAASILSFKRRLWSFVVNVGFEHFLSTGFFLSLSLRYCHLLLLLTLFLRAPVSGGCIFPWCPVQCLLHF